MSHPHAEREEYNRYSPAKVLISLREMNRPHAEYNRYSPGFRFAFTGLLAK